MTDLDEHMFALGPCIRCDRVFTFDPATVPSVWVNTATRCPVRTDGTAIEPGEAGTAREQLCETCAPVVRATLGKRRPVLELFPHARVDRIHPSTNRPGVSE